MEAIVLLELLIILVEMQERHIGVSDILHKFLQIFNHVSFSNSKLLEIHHKTFMHSGVCSHSSLFHYRLV